MKNIPLPNLIYKGKLIKVLLFIQKKKKCININRNLRGNVKKRK